MPNPIYWVLFYGNAQALEDLDNYQKKHWGCHIEKPQESLPQTPEIPVDTEELDIVKFMSEAPHHPRRVT